MPLRVLLLRPFSDSSENEMFASMKRDLERALRDEKAILLGNLSASSQIDAVLIRRDSIVVLEMKNYAGHIKGSENNDWSCTSSRTTTINTGRENPFDQVRTYRGNVVEKLKEASDPLGAQRAEDTSDRWIRFVSGLVVFNRMDSFTSSLNFDKCKWFRVTDIAGLSDKILEIRSRAIELTDEETDVVADVLTNGRYTASMKTIPKTVTAHNAEKRESRNERKPPIDLVRPRGPFSGITRDDVERALDIIDRKGVPDNRISKRWILKSRGKDYPTKYVVSMAGLSANGKVLDHQLFIARQANEFLSSFDYLIVDKNTGEKWAR